MHPATRELLGIIAYVLFLLYGSWRLARWSAPHVSKRRVGSVVVMAFLLSASCGLGLALLINASFRADFCIYLILGVATMGSTVGETVGLARIGEVRRHAFILALATGTVSVLLIPRFLL